MIASRGTALCATAIGIASGAAFARWRRPRRSCCGATEIERAASLPGDELIPDASARNTRAISILAQPDAVWPWLAQMGADRGGFYSYDLLEDLFGLSIHSADVVVDAWQDVHVGDVVYADRRQGGGWYVDEVRPGVALVLQLADLRRGRPVRRTDPAGWEFVWAFVLIDRGDGSTRLLVRESVVFRRRVVRLLMAPVGLVSSVMTHRMLLGIKERAELAEAAGARAALTSAS